MNDLDACREKLSAYVQGRLLARLGLAGRPFALEPAHAGIHSRVFYLTAEGHAPLVVKVFDRRRRFRAALACARHLAGHGIAAPKVVWAEEGGRFFSRRGMHVLCEERIEGPSLQHLELTADIIEKAARLYAGLHAVERGTWGAIAGGSRRGLYGYLEKKMRKRLDGWSRAGGLSPAERKRILAAFAAGRPAMDRISSFSLSHTDPNRNNLILRASDRKLFLLDTGSLRYLPRAIDYFMVQAYCCLGRPDHEALFERTYQQGLSAQQLEAFRETRDVFRLYVIILFVHDLTTRFAALDHSSPWYGEFAGLIPVAKQALAKHLEAM